MRRMVCVTLVLLLIGTVTSVFPAFARPRWTLQVTPNPPGATFSQLRAVACPSDTECIAVGVSPIGHPLAERWDGATWTILPTPTSGTFTYSLFDVSCSSTTACTAVGVASNGSSDETLAAVWNGSTWTIQPTPNPDSPASALLGVSCASLSSCTAVGWFDAPNQTLLIEAWNGSSWSIQTAPLPPGLTSVLSSVSCSSATSCAAVGIFSRRHGAALSLAESWDGKAWKIQRTPHKFHGFNALLLSVACPTPTYCVAVGSSHEQTLVMTSNGKSWTVQDSPNPPGVAYFDGVECTSATACIAVGYSEKPPDFHRLTLLESWDGTSWVVQKTPNQTGAMDSVLIDPACSASICEAVGYSQDAEFHVSTLAIGSG